MDKSLPPSERWARFRLTVIGPLLAAPPRTGRLRAALQAVSTRSYEHPITGAPMTLAFSTVERWYYAARNADPASDDWVAPLRRRVRKDRGKRRTISAALADALRAQYREHPTWSYLTHFDNLRALAANDETLGAVPTYATVRRFMKSQGWVRQRRRSDHRIASGPREVRSYEMPYAHSMWHLDFHVAKRNVVLSDGSHVAPKLLAISDDHSRVCCHAQWYLQEGAEQLVHGLRQALLKRGLPRSIMMDNGSAMVAAETVRGLHDLGIQQVTTRPYSPHQNGKQEHFFGPLEGRMMAMLESVEVLDLELLNRATIAWVERDYHRRHNREIGESPLDRLARAQSVGRRSPSPQKLRECFRMVVKRKQRRSDGTCSIEGVRFEVPSRYRHMAEVHVRLARWDLSFVHLVDPAHCLLLCPLHPVDKVHNASGVRRNRDDVPVSDEPAPASGRIAPYLQQLMDEHAQTGLMPAYLPTPPNHNDQEQDDDG
ncbi:MAG: DDE-type integrase/transposase/recombinase [Myxococcales bacterium]|nr:DDE-type integrase/transposase/recombinase [Myxococcales bacterium]